MHNFRYSKLKMCYCTVLLFDSCSVSHLWLAKWASCVNSWPAHTPVGSEWGTIFQTWGGNQNPDANCNTFLTFFLGGGARFEFLLKSAPNFRTEFTRNTPLQFRIINIMNEWMKKSASCILTRLNTTQYLFYLAFSILLAAVFLTTLSNQYACPVGNLEYLA